jgi:hypothetical protein
MSNVKFHEIIVKQFVGKCIMPSSIHMLHLYRLCIMLSCTDLDVKLVQCTRVVRKRRFPMIFHNEKHVYWH